jgi:hypothetical protein
MIESELAFNKDGEPFPVPETVSGWRVRRLRGGRGAPELVYAPDGSPLTLDIEAGMDELRDAVDTSGRHRLDPIDADGKVVPNVGPAYVHVAVAPRNASVPSMAADAPLSGTDHAIRELVRAQVELARSNSELAKTVATQQPDLIKAAAEILRAADGAGLPRREGMADWEGDEAAADAAVPPGSPGSVDWAVVAHEAIGAVKALAGLALAKSAGRASAKAPAAGTQASAAATPSAETPSDRAEPRADTEGEAAAQPAPSAAVDPDAHLVAIQAQLTPAERAYVFSVINKLSVADMMRWRDQLANMSVGDAVQMIRNEIEKRTKEVAS